MPIWTAVLAVLFFGESRPAACMVGVACAAVAIALLVAHEGGTRSRPLGIALMQAGGAVVGLRHDPDAPHALALSDAGGSRCG